MAGEQPLHALCENVTVEGWVVVEAVKKEKKYMGYDSHGDLRELGWTKGGASYCRERIVRDSLGRVRQIDEMNSIFRQDQRCRMVLYVRCHRGGRVFRGRYQGSLSLSQEVFQLQMKLFYPNRPSADGGHEAHLNMKEQNEALARLEESFPNGFHDAKLTALSLDLAGSRLRLGLLIEVSRTGESHVSSVYSKGELEITGLAAFHVGDIRFGRMEASASDEMVDVSHDSSECQRLAKALDDETCFVAEVYLLRSNASITFAGRGAQWSWTGKA